ncbi:MAG TPA: CrcB family protein [Myxococcota bacterium]|nr:CrcB family protein [Myxococcota bacterium]
MTLATLASVAIGGALGATLRYAVSTWLASAAARGEFPWNTLLVNLAGTAILAVLTALALNGKGLGDAWQTLLGPGFCGALTTFSTVAVELVLLVRAGATNHAVLYGTVSFLGAVALVVAIFAGLRVGR